MRKWPALMILGILLAFPFSVSAQTQNRLTNFDVQLWPEYDKPSMLVICDFQLPADTLLPAEVSFRLPKEADVIAVASYQPNGLMEADHSGPVQNGDWQVLTISVKSQTQYHFEYYEPLVKSGSQREFKYVWPGDFAVDQFTIRVQEPMDTPSITTTPKLTPSKGSDGLVYYGSQPISLAAGQSYALSLTYEKKSDALTAPNETIQPSQDLGSNTAGRVSFDHYLPYIAGGVGGLLIVIGIGYYFLTHRAKPASPRRRRGHPAETSESQVYCHQCGQRARPGDRFCRVCGTRLRQEG